MNPDSIRFTLWHEIQDERDRQDRIFGWSDNPASILPGLNEHAKNTVLAEKAGEVARAVNEMGLAKDVRSMRQWEDNLETELVQVAAVALAWLEGRRQRAAIERDEHLNRSANAVFDRNLGDHAHFVAVAKEVR